jgi:hypothetical protein
MKTEYKTINAQGTTYEVEKNFFDLRDNSCSYVASISLTALSENGDNYYFELGLHLIRRDLQMPVSKKSPPSIFMYDAPKKQLRHDVRLLLTFNNQRVEVASSKYFFDLEFDKAKLSIESVPVEIAGEVISAAYELKNEIRSILAYRDILFRIVPRDSLTHYDETELKVNNPSGLFATLHRFVKF